MLKKALLVGINDYRYASLRGCVNDVIEMKSLLIELFDFRDDNIRVLIDGDAEMDEIVKGLEWLAVDGTEPTIRVIQYAGYGHSLPAMRPNGAVKALAPYDYEKKGYLTNDKLLGNLAHFPEDGLLTLIMDCCYAGTNQRSSESDVIFRFLPVTYEERKSMEAFRKDYLNDQKQYISERNKQVPNFGNMQPDDLKGRIHDLMKEYEQDRLGDHNRKDLVIISACMDDQSAADVKMAGNYHGVFTYFLLKAIREANGKITYGNLVEQVLADLHDSSFNQNVQLECNKLHENLEIFSPT